MFVQNSDGETGNPLVAEFEDDLSSTDEMPCKLQPKLLENPLCKQRHKRKDVSLISESTQSRNSKRDSMSSIEQELQMTKLSNSDDHDGNSDEGWLGQQNCKWRQSPEGGEDVCSNVNTKKDKIELSDKSLNASVTSSNVHLDLLDNSGDVHLSSDSSSSVIKEKKKHKDKVYI